MLPEVRTHLRTVAVSGLTAAVLAGAGLGLMSMAENGSFLAPVNATSHWLFGAEKAAGPGFRSGPTVVGLITHVAASLFWAAMMALALWRWRLTGGLPLMAAGLATAATAGVIDYGILPRALSPGWHLVLPPAGVAAGFACLGLGLGAGACMARRGAVLLLPPR